MQNRFQKIRELGSKGRKSNPLLLEEFQWESEWVDENSESVYGDTDGLTWTVVDEVAGATQGLRGRNLPRAAAARAATAVNQTFVRKRKRARITKVQDQDIAQDEAEEEGSDSSDEAEGSDSAAMEEDEDCGQDSDGGFQLNADLLD
jgi:hypothetical protein